MKNGESNRIEKKKERFGEKNLKLTGLEPATFGFGVRCTTNYATASFQVIKGETNKQTTVQNGEKEKKQTRKKQTNKQKTRIEYQEL